MAAQVDYLKLAEQYASFLIALGGVSITILTLVLTLGREPAKRSKKIKRCGPHPARTVPPLSYRATLHSLLVASLVVATLACFLGAHLMAETAAFVSPLTVDVKGARLFLIASVNIYMAAMLFIFALMVLPSAYNIRGTADLTQLTKSVFISVVCSAYVWMGYSAAYRFFTSQCWYSLIVSTVLGLALWAYLGCNNTTGPTNGNRFLQLPFMMITVFMTTSLLYLARSFDDGGVPNNLDVWFFCMVVSSSCGALLGLASRFVWNKRPVPEGQRVQNAAVEAEKAVSPDAEGEPVEN